MQQQQIGSSAATQPGVASEQPNPPLVWTHVPLGPPAPKRLKVSHSGPAAAAAASQSPVSAVPLQSGSPAPGHVTPSSPPPVPSVAAVSTDQAAASSTFKDPFLRQLMEFLRDTPLETHYAAMITLIKAAQQRGTVGKLREMIDRMEYKPVPRVHRKTSLPRSASVATAPSSATTVASIHSVIGAPPPSSNPVSVSPFSEPDSRVLAYQPVPNNFAPYTVSNEVMINQLLYQCTVDELMRIQHTLEILLHRKKHELTAAASAAVAAATDASPALRAIDLTGEPDNEKPQTQAKPTSRTNDGGVEIMM